MAGLFYPPPQPFMGGFQPLAPRELPASITDLPPAAVNDPPFGTFPLRAAMAYAVLLRSWRPPDPPPWIGRYVPPPAPLGDNPPFMREPRALLRALEQWQPGAPWLYQVPRGMPVSVDNPPRYSPAPYLALMSVAWQVAPPWPGRYAKQISSVDNPPPRRGALPAPVLQTWQIGYQTPQIGRYAPQVAPAAAQPSYGIAQYLAAVAGAWVPAFPARSPWTLRGIVQPGAGAQVDNPPVKRPLSLSSILAFWQIVPPRPWSGWHLPQSLGYTLDFGRVYTVAAANRSFAPAVRLGVYTVPAQGRAFSVPAASRTFTVPGPG